jgi:hypothetical protein
VQRKTVIWRRSPQNSSALSAWALRSRPSPTRVSETKRVTITAMVIDTLRRRPVVSSETT